MTTITFDTLKYSKALKDAGFTSSQAEGQAQALSEILEINFSDLVTLPAEIKKKIMLVHYQDGGIEKHNEVAKNSGFKEWVSGDFGFIRKGTVLDTNLIF